MECKRCGAYSYSRKSSLCSKCRYDLKIEKAVSNAQMRAKNLHIHAVSNSVCPNCGAKGYKTTLTNNSYACKKCETWWANGC